MNEVRVTTMTDAVKALIEANNFNADIIKSLQKANKRLAFSVFCLSAAGYLTFSKLCKQTLRIDELEKKLESLTKPEEPASE